MSVVALSGLAVTPAQADTTSGEALTASIVIPERERVTRDLGTVPSGLKSVEVKFFTSEVESRTQVELAVGPEGSKSYSFTAPAGTSPTKTITVPVTPEMDGTVTAVSSDADVKLNLSVVGFERAESSPEPAPTPAPTPEPTPAPTPTPTPAPAPAPAPAPVPVTSGTPGASNTGVPSGTALTVHNGDINVTEPGTVLSGLDVRGLIKISAPDVTIKNSIIRGRTMNGPGALINNLGGHRNLVVTDTELSPSTASPDANGIYGYNFTATRLDINNVIDGIHITGSNVSLQDSWIHDHMHYRNDPNQGGSPSHDDGIQIQAGNNVTVTGNRLTDSHSAAVQITQDRGPVSNFTFSDNFANGGACTVNIAEKSYGPIRGATITDNSFGRDSRLANCAVIAPTTTKIDFANNYYVPDDTLVTIKKG
ncbi:right-handed parallel beta-helix repeat-containing protein [Cryobacterium serini]|uniref:right-handed parallel beta-helix repeat-containing protein n=1 Tax=Cryobacterium serini TaxID=1259201 RepID=UPI00141B366E|nr:right-handed parallel beta-helix repeat-containing protein [Cryobacterium serini]